MVTMVIAPVFALSPVETEALVQPNLVEEVPITLGAQKKTYAYGDATIHVIEVDLTNPYVAISALSPQNQVAKRETLSQMTSQSGAIASINADFFNTKGEGAPLGVMVREGDLITSPVKLNAIYSLGINTHGLAQIDQFAFSGLVTSSDGATFSLSGVNKTPYYEEPTGVHSHVNQLHLYTEHWAKDQRGHDGLTTPTEVLVKDQVVQSIHVDTYYPGPVPSGAVVLRGHGAAAKFLKDHVKVGDVLNIAYKVSPEDTWQMVIGGHSLLVDQGQVVAYGRSLTSQNSIVARSAVGISQDGKRLFLVALAHSGDSKGLSLKALSEFLSQIGVWKALNLDGGGSTTMLARPLGEVKAIPVLKPQEGSERAIVNGIGLFSTAPAGSVAGGVLVGPEAMVIGQSATFGLKLYDTYYNPFNPSQAEVTWMGGQADAITGQGVYTATALGEQAIQVEINDLTLSKTVQVVGRDEITQMTLVDLGNPTGLLAGNQRQLKVRLETTKGHHIEVPGSALEWQLEGVSGFVTADNVLTLNSEVSTVAYITASYQGFKATLTLTPTSVRTILSMSALKGIVFEKLPTTVRGFVDVIGDPVNASQQVLRLNYDFTDASGTQAAYYKFPNSGVSIDAQVEDLGISVFGNRGGEWIRAELVDAKGALQRITIASKVDWNGWKTISIPIKTLEKPLTLKRIYVVGVESDWQLASKQGEVYFKDLTVKAPSKDVAIEDQVRDPITLTLGSKTLQKGDVVSLMDAVPEIYDGRTLVPLRFISEALGARVSWDSPTKNAAIWQKGRWVDLWYEVNYMVMAGKRLELDVAPRLVSGRLMIPLRAVAESMDVKVTWDPKTKQIILQ